MITKQHLLEKNLIIDNDYANLYVELINLNKDLLPVKNSTQKHHIIPKYYYRYNQEDIDDSDLNTINLYYKDHILAHYWLSLCSYSKYFKFANICALKYLLGINKYLLENEDFLSNLNYLQELYEDYFNSRADYIDLSHINDGKVWMTDGLVSKRVLPENIDFFISEGFHFGINFKTNEGKVTINNGIVTKFIPKEEVSNYIDKGWQKGFLSRSMNEEARKNLSKLTQSRNLDTVAINNGEINKYIKKEFLNNYLTEGWVKGLIIRNKPTNRNKHVYSDEEKQSLSDRMSNTIWMHKDTVNVRVKNQDIDSYIDEGFCIGRYIEDNSVFSSNVGHKWVNKDGININILSTEVDEYLGKGYVLGRDMSFMALKKHKSYVKGEKHANSGGCYLYKDGKKKHFHDEEIEKMLQEGWVTYKQLRKNI